MLIITVKINFISIKMLLHYHNLLRHVRTQTNSD